MPVQTNHANRIADFLRKPGDLAKKMQGQLVILPLDGDRLAGVGGCEKGKMHMADRFKPM